jgi:hypothetical protein
MTIPSDDLPSILNSFYVNQKSIASIVEKYSYLKGNSLHKLFPLYVHDDLICEHCSASLNSRFAKKSAVESGRDLLCFDLKSEAVEEVSLSDNDKFNPFDSLRWSAISQDVSLKTKEGYVVGEPYCVLCEHQPRRTCLCAGCNEIKDNNRSVLLEELQRPMNNAHVDIEGFSSRQIFWSLMAITYAKQETGLAVDEIGRDFLVHGGIYKVVEASYDQVLCFVSLNQYRLRHELLEYEYEPGTLGGENEVSSLLKTRAFQMFLHEEFRLEVVELWMELALSEALMILAHYCNQHEIPYRPGEKTISAVRKSLRKYGLAQTARYILNAVRFASRCAVEQRLSGREAFNRIYGSLNFWIDDDRARDYTASPFTRKVGVFEETKSVIVFSSSFLELHDIDYFKDPIKLTGNIV